MLESLPELLAKMKSLFDGIRDKLNTKLDKTATAIAAAKLSTARNLTLTGDGNWTVNFDGTTDVTASLTLAATGVAAGAYPKVTVDAKGRVTAGSALTPADVPTLNQSTTGNAATATKWATARTLSYTGDATGTASLDGSANVAFALTLAASGVVAGTYSKLTVDAKGRVTAGAALLAADIPALDTSKLTTGVLPVARGGTGGFNMAARNITISTADPSGGADGDIWIKYA